LRAENLIKLINALDMIERLSTGKQTSRVQRLDISTAESVLTSLRQADEAPQERSGRLAAANAPHRERV
jgi:hypothetical protein